MPTDELREAAADPAPVRQFQLWFDAAVAAGLPEPNGMTLATCTADGVPSARIVLLKICDERGLAFFTNYQSRKGRELANNPRAALVFFWPALERQVRVEGRVELVSADESDAYFAGRPVNSRLGAWASEQSAVIPSRDELERKRRVYVANSRAGGGPRRPFGGGFRVGPDVFDFWQARPSRLHDRLRYRRVAGRWVIERLSP